MSVYEDSKLALLCEFCEDAFHQALISGSEASILEPAQDPRLEPKWRVVGVLQARDAIFKIGPIALGEKTVFYGWVLESTEISNTFVIVVRGTADAIEWWEDSLWAPRREHPVVGEVECGFWSVFETMTLAGSSLPLVPALLNIIGTGSVTVIGHSLGAAIASYLNFELSRSIGYRARGRFFASPRPGDKDFATAFASQVNDYVSYRYQPDIVPDVPRGFGYSPLQNLLTLPSDERINDSLLCNHHALVIAWLLDPISIPSLTCDKEFASCIRVSS